MTSAAFLGGPADGAVEAVADPGEPETREGETYLPGRLTLRDDDGRLIADWAFYVRAGDAERWTPPMIAEAAAQAMIAAGENKLHHYDG